MTASVTTGDYPFGECPIEVKRVPLSIDYVDTIRPHTGSLQPQSDLAPSLDCGTASMAYPLLSRPIASATHAASSPPTSMSTILFRLVVPRTRVTERRGSRNATATARNAASVAFPPSAGSATRTTSAPSNSPPTEVLDEPGRTWIPTRTSSFSCTSSPSGALMRGELHTDPVSSLRCPRAHKSGQVGPRILGLLFESLAEHPLLAEWITESTPTLAVELVG